MRNARVSGWLSLLILTASASAQLTAIVPQVRSKLTADHKITTVELTAHFVTTIRVPEPVNSVVVGDPALFQVEHSEAVESKIGAVETRLDSKIDSVESRLESKINVVDSKVDVLRSEMRSGFSALGAALENAVLRGELSTTREIADLRIRVERLEKERGQLPQ